ncbi:MAG: hypothetical protein WD795_02800 [Woeseia sp.]
MGSSSCYRQGASDDAAEEFSGDLEVQIHEAILTREKTGDSFPDRNAVEAMEEPLHRLTGAAVLFSDITTESSAAPELRMRGLSFLAEAMFREAMRLFRLYHGRPGISGRRRGRIRVAADTVLFPGPGRGARIR